MSAKGMLTRLVVALVLAAPLASLAQDEQKKMAVGVFLPTSMTDGQERFNFAEKLAAALATQLGQPVIGRSFGRYEDFAKAAGDGSVDFAVVEGWAAAESSMRFEPVALGVIGGETHQRWALISRRKGPVKELGGKRLALAKGAGSYDAKFVTNAIFGGDLDAQRHFKLVPVPSVESALKMLEVNSAESALVPVNHVPKGSPVVYRSRALPGPMVLAFRGKAAELRTALNAIGAMEPFDRFVDLGAGDIDELRRLIVSGPGKRQPLVAESPLVRPEASSVLNLRDVGAVFPSFVETMEIPKEQPDD
jgi:hypothetical protein